MKENLTQSKKYHKMVTKTDRLEQIRGRLGLNKTEFADAMGVSNRYYYNILSGAGSGNLRLEHLESLLQRFKVNPAWVLTGEGEMFLEIQDNTTEWISGSIVPDIPITAKIDEELLSYLVNKVAAASGAPMVRDDLGYSLLIRFGRYYIHRSPDATLDNLDIPALTASFLTLLQTVQSMVDAVFELESEGRVVVSFEGRYYNFQRQGRPAR